ncbi:hypothetical protein SeLEV6574_g03025 [Synchytrium endobioticum]|uniref:N-acetyltransferase domain-containing protein n=1 Tax=Synchytrium endobioticum TaxID=286115 RepID=A0A507D5T9_9FUNG|nr:hypothetical protein SeLEV6574_g03025 [Synchytrium endobioticum]
MTTESCSSPSPSLRKTRPGQALVTTATSNRDLPEEQDVDCGHILAELAMVSERMCTLVDRTKMFYATKVVQDLLPPVGNNRVVTRKWTYSRELVDPVTVRNNFVLSGEDRSAVLEALADVGDVDYLQEILDDWRKRESALFTCFGHGSWPKIFISEDGKWTWGTCQHDTILSSAKTFAEERIAGIASVTFKFQHPDYRVMVMTRSAADECVGVIAGMSKPKTYGYPTTKRGVRENLFFLDWFAGPGLGARMWKFLEGWCLTSGCKSILLSAWLNTDSHRFYNSMGCWRIAGMDAEGDAAIWMEKRLNVYNLRTRRSAYPQRPPRDAPQDALERYVVDCDCFFNKWTWKYRPSQMEEF